MHTHTHPLSPIFVAMCTVHNIFNSIIYCNSHFIIESLHEQEFEKVSEKEKKKKINRVSHIWNAFRLVY